MKPKTAIYYKSGIGNLIQATPMLQAFASMDQSGMIDICLADDWQQDPRIPALMDIFEHMPFINQVVRYPGISLDDYDVWSICINCEMSNASKNIANKLRAGTLWGDYDWLGTLSHERDVNMMNAYTVGYVGRIPDLYAPMADDDYINEQIVSHRNRPVIAICNGAFDAPMWKKKLWPHFGELSAIIKKYYGKGTIIGIGDKGELDGVHLDYDYCGKLSITQTAKVINWVDLLITTDTGNMHIADALKIPGIALFGPTLVSKNGPLNGTIEIIRADVPCSPCQYENRFWECTFYGCMESISVGMVMEKVREMI